MTVAERREASMARTELEILRMLPKGYSEEDIFELRVNMGMDYLVRRHGYRNARQMWKQSEFWTWWRWAWYQNDVKIINYVIGNELPLPITWELYEETQEAKMMMYRVSPRLINV